ncbi:MAG: M48 family metallopeptidase [Candidatus Omnitrophica bacterium]|nr:M48 family metallopeptidase [Candidatus Omnitrophota bacterium]
MIDSLKKNAVGLVIGLIIIEAIYTFLKIFPNTWWVWATCFWLFISFVLAKLVPNFLIPMFFKYAPIEDEELKGKINDLFEACKVPVKDISTIDLSTKTKKANAFLCGVGKKKRVVLSDTLVEQFSNEEICSVVAHELGHHKHNDILKLLFVNTFATAIGFYLVKNFLNFTIHKYGLSSIDDIALFPLIILALMVFGFVITPMMNLYSRRIEKAADRFCLDQTKDAPSFISLMKKLGDMNLAEFDPDFFTEMFFHDHPTLKKRIEFAEKYKHEK